MKIQKIKEKSLTFQDVNGGEVFVVLDDKNDIFYMKTLETPLYNVVELFSGKLVWIHTGSKVEIIKGSFIQEE